MRRKLVASVPLLAFLGIAGAVASTLYRESASGYSPAEIPSALIGRTHPLANFPPVDGFSAPRLDESVMSNTVTIVNVFASWCVPCRQEHPYLMELAKDSRISIVGINYKDDPAKAAAFLEENGNPFRAIGADVAGRAAIDWGVYGVPETFVIDRAGRVVMKHVGPLDEASVSVKIVPALEKAVAKN